MSYPREGRRAIVGPPVGMRCAMRRVRSSLRSLYALAALAMLAAHAATAAPPFATDPVSFATQLNVTPGQLVESAPVTVTGIATNAAVIVIVFNGEISKGCTGVYRGNYIPFETAQNGDTFCVRHVSAAAPDTVVRTLVQFLDGNVLDEDQAPSTWGAFVTSTGTTLDPTPDPLLAEPAPRRHGLWRDTTVDAFMRISGTNVPSALVVTSAQHGVERAVIGVSGQPARIYSGPQPEAYPGDVILLRQRASASYSTTVTGTVNVGGVSGTFETRTLGPRKILEGALLDFDGNDINDSVLPDTYPGGRRIYMYCQAGWSWMDLDLSQWSVERSGDFDADERSDLLWRNASTGETAIWLVKDAKYQSGATVMRDPAWRVSHSADFDGDRRTDLVWVNETTGTTSLWLVSGLDMHDGATLLVDPDWRVELTADLDGNDKSDLIWRNRATGATAAWLMDGKRYAGGSILVADANWRAVHAGDFDGDGKDDLVWYNASTGRTAVWLMDGVTLPFREGALLQLPIGWQWVASGDFNGDGRADLLFNDPSTGALWYSLRDGLANVYTGQFGNPDEQFAGLTEWNGITSVVLTTANPPTCKVRELNRLLDGSCPSKSLY